MQADLAHNLRIVSDGDDALPSLAGKGADAEPDRAPRSDLILLDLNLPRMSGYGVGGRMWMRWIIVESLYEAPSHSCNGFPIWY